MRILSAGPADLWLDTEPQALEPVLKHLRMYKIGRHVEISDRTADRTLLSLIGPASQTVAERAAGVAVPEGEHAWIDAGVGDAAARIAQTALGLDVLVEAEASATLAAALREAGARPVGPDVAEILRVEHGIPRLGVDMGAEHLPGEAGIVDRAVSFTKGCYIGQEPVARMYHRGRPNRRLRGLLLSAPAARGEPVTAAGKEVGRLGTSVISPRLGPIALVVLRREAEAGDEVLVGDGMVRAKVVELPFDGG
jgi:folate-binding protein YgfZ